MPLDILILVRSFRVSLEKQKHTPTTLTDKQLNTKTTNPRQ